MDFTVNDLGLIIIWSMTVILFFMGFNSGRIR